MKQNVNLAKIPKGRFLLQSLKSDKALQKTVKESTILLSKEILTDILNKSDQPLDLIQKMNQSSEKLEDIELTFTKTLNFSEASIVLQPFLYGNKVRYVLKAYTISSKIKDKICHVNKPICELEFEKN